MIIFTLSSSKASQFSSSFSLALLLIALFFRRHHYRPSSGEGTGTSCVVDAFSTSHQPSSQLRRRKCEQGLDMLNGNKCNIVFHWHIFVQTRTSIYTCAVPLSAKGANMKDDEDGNVSLEDVAAPAFIIQSISKSPINDAIFRRISSLCIDVFFKVRRRKKIWSE